VAGSCEHAAEIIGFFEGRVSVFHNKYYFEDSVHLGYSVVLYGELNLQGSFLWTSF